MPDIRSKLYHSQSTIIGPQAVLRGHFTNDRVTISKFTGSIKILLLFCLMIKNPLIIPIFLFFNCVLVTLGYSQGGTSDTTSKTVDLDEVVVSVNKGVEIKRTVAQQVKIINSAEISFLQSQTTADILSNSGSAFVQKSQQGGGSPILRGFEASRILLVIDGVRMNNLIYRAGHLQNIITVDNSNLEKAEVLYGPSSTMYGSDALGGVIHLYTKNPVHSFNREKKHVEVNAFTRYGSTNDELCGYADFNIGGKDFASLSTFSISRFEDLRSGESKNPFYDSTYGERPMYVERINNVDSLIVNDDPYLQKFSGYTQYNFSEKISYKKNDHLQHRLNLQYSTSTDVPRYDRLTDPSGSGLRYAEWYYGPQMRLLAAYDLNIKSDSGFFQSCHIGVNYQKVRESRHDRRYKNDNINHRTEDVSVAGVNLDLRRVLRKQIIRVGFEAQYNSLKSTANKENIVTGEISDQSTRYPDGTNTMSNFAVYWSHTYKINQRFSLVDGIRLGYSTLYSTFVDKSFYDFPYSEVKQNNMVYSGNAGLILCPNEKIKYSLLVSTGFRVPNIDDLSKVFESAPGSVIVPNSDLKPEKTINVELGFASVIREKYYWENALYYTRYFDAIVTSPYTFEGSDSIMYEGTNSAVFANQNEGKAYLLGFSSSLNCHHSAKFNSSVSANYTYGRIETDSVDAPLDHIPPFLLHFQTQYTSNKLNVQFFVNYNSWKRIEDYYLNGEDNEQYATPDGMPAWITLNLHGAFKISKLLSINGGIDNILDTQYRAFASGINGAGRHLFVGVKFGYRNS